MPAHPCQRPDRCAAVIAAGGEIAERIHAEVEAAEAQRLKQAVWDQAGSSETLPRLIERSAPTKPSLAALVAGSSASRVASQLLMAGRVVLLPNNSRSKEVRDGVSSRDQR
jgi:hypothetical protein